MRALTLSRILENLETTGPQKKGNLSNHMGLLRKNIKSGNDPEGIYRDNAKALKDPNRSGSPGFAARRRAR